MVDQSTFRSCFRLTNQPTSAWLTSQTKFMPMVWLVNPKQSNWLTRQPIVSSCGWRVPLNHLMIAFLVSEAPAAPGGVFFLLFFLVCAVNFGMFFWLTSQLWHIFCWRVNLSKCGQSWRVVKKKHISLTAYRRAKAKPPAFLASPRLCKINERGQKKKVVKHDRGDVQRIELIVLIRALRTIRDEL